MHPALRIILSLVGIYLFYCGLLFVLQRQMLFPKQLAMTLDSMPEKFPGLEKIWLQLPGMRIESWFLPARTRVLPAPAVILSHGNAETIDFLPEEFHHFTARGVSLMMVEYPGYGRSQGTPSQKTISATMQKAYDVLVARPDVDPERIILMGRSVGAGAACQLARLRPACAMILISPFISVTSFARRYLVPPVLVKDPFDNLAVIRSFKKPLLIVHGTKDEIIPYRHGTALAAAAENSRLVSLDCGHNDMPTDAPYFWQEIDTFFEHARLFPR